MTSKIRSIAAGVVLAGAMFAQTALQPPPPSPPGAAAQRPPQQPEFVRRGFQLFRNGQQDAALALFEQEAKADPKSVAANNAAGTALDLLGRGEEARKYFVRAIDAASSPEAKARARRQLAMSYAFESDCGNTVKVESQVYDYYVSTGDAYQQGEIADEMARVCLESGNLDAATKWYRIGHDAGLKEPNIKPERVALWHFRWEHAQARIAARRNRAAEARKHAELAKQILDGSPEMAKQQAIFYPYLAGYIAFHARDYKTAADQLLKANQSDPFIQYLLGQSYEKLGQPEKADACYRLVASTIMHSPPAAASQPFARRKLAAAKK
jgi:Flp pilus assembly protein TadD